MQNEKQEITQSQENEDSEDEENDTHQPQLLASRPTLKHNSSHPLDNLISPLNSEVHTRSKTRNLVAFSYFISTIETKNFKEALSDADWVNSLQEELHQFERSKVWYVVPRPVD